MPYFGFAVERDQCQRADGGVNLPKPKPSKLENHQRQL
jgi:hypothetical protein